MTWGVDLLVNVILKFRWLRPLTDVSRRTAKHAKTDRESNLYARLFVYLYLPRPDRGPDEVQNLSQVKDRQETT